MSDLVGTNTFNIMTITILSQFFLNAPRTISAFAAVKRLLDLDIKFLAICLALDGLVAMPNPETKSTPKNSEHYSNPDNAKTQQVFENQFIAINLDFSRSR
ncbi:hypothetical protein [Vibrio vulnificus YJ016]|uniref:Uncharacterized protein n=1 Tax=Vibrio vulnificus (strain YJ016) TaxID=196600 RepID=Q7MKP1_VIBVY|nr:hypothetical protein [Vibrio vulnificus YJ016]